MATEESFAPAKINLTLHVTAQRPDGYHMLDSLVVFAAVGDRLAFDPGPRLSLAVTGPFAAGVPADGSNLVWRAAELAGWTGHITLEKNLPHGAGIGGGSADAAAALRMLGQPDLDSAEALGADVPVCLSAVAKRVQGIGEILTPLSNTPALDLVLVNPGGHLPTPTVFGALEDKMNDPMEGVGTWSDRGWLVDWLCRQRNDLTAPAIRLAPQIATALAALEHDAELARMSGSGATCFGIYPDAEQARSAAARIAAQHPDWWVQPTRSIGARPAAIS
ncbi:4-(cytidine 5'-diphospho)-2-C-methyl-D-erythritol kinase [Lutimaribacter sp. EGI FJ00015]|uniref:4-(Cytidine 5'-diphospho)-2-C-methyl-D-erythritol kinase n=1 Tax=Lutimaribacter degradans TaxID=2945989 RepID=A0ACC5ZVH3_9RHOB|nr:4-(cytidine 5'-diphospho)-2-C-methyl-D-erythritol kinase [Lutimaribacter sp. EGI FJ00013]MCM2561549.1 4-(cytidine 5'-diphospho)-2-C-methyl-D-erythritol kinase [Lutimaribacter sp. EGI FJ00013]MCO0612740.1 4-(cytidine 5'-diphospho)-2-C-methyl-D-erythritol kinase [Lutimaribacter sp. EGI FJ00015]MCO0635398.1 4-(cytidine 5'-diphospho)-2-C-methyl-D-erythritol kinase [Lutimaribacter sp. EGI FJ00014]